MYELERYLGAMKCLDQVVQSIAMLAIETHKAPVKHNVGESICSPRIRNLWLESSDPIRYFHEESGFLLLWRFVVHFVCQDIDRC